MLGPYACASNERYAGRLSPSSFLSEMRKGAHRVQPTVESPETGLEQRGRLAASLTAMLADAYVLMVKTQGFHWNVVGPLFVIRTN